MRKVLGEPNSVSHRIGTEVWTYGEEGLASLTFKNGKVHEFHNYKNILPIGKREAKTIENKKSEPNWKQLIKEAEDEAAKAKSKRTKSVFGTDDAQFTSTSQPAINYTTFEGGKYAEIAKDQNWDLYTFPSDAEQRLNEYNMKRYLMFGTLGLGFLLIVYFLLKKRIDP